MLVLDIPVNRLQQALGPERERCHHFPAPTGRR
uniref:Uncharacterized protein n=1 Tax=Arundo donax TaxID=35708 RepID=A0A0A9ADZ5_ARUDO